MAATANRVQRLGRQLLIHNSVLPTHHGGVKMRLSAKDPTPPQTDLSAPMCCLTKPHLTGSAEPNPPNNPSAAVAPSSPRDLLTAEQERVMVEHLPIVRLIARRIHDRLPQHVPIEDLFSAGVLGLLDAFGRFDPSKFYSARMRSFVSGEPFSTVCERSTGVLGSCGARGGLLRRQSKRL
jgi:hypothetical protein